jgi:hypothetical protein
MLVWDFRHAWQMAVKPHAALPTTQDRNKAQLLAALMLLFMLGHGAALLG